MLRSICLATVIAIFWSVWAGPGVVRADYLTQTVTLDQSNTLKDGVAYGSVLIEAYNGVGIGGGGLNAGEARLTYSAAVVADYASVSKTFGIQTVGFNTDLALLAGQITGPAGWKVASDKTMSAFGKFNWNVDGSAKGGALPNPVTLLITGLGASATPDHFLFGSAGSGKTPPTEGSVYFAMHVVGFEVTGSQVTSHFVGGSTTGEIPPPPEGSGEVEPTPEPSTLVLAGACLGCLCLVRLSARGRGTQMSS